DGIRDKLGLEFRRVLFRSVWEIASENAVDRLEEPTRVLGIVEIALVQNQIGAFGLDKLEDASEPVAAPAIADEGDFQVRVRRDRSEERRVGKGGGGWREEG